MYRIIDHDDELERMYRGETLLDPIDIVAWANLDHWFARVERAAFAASDGVAFLDRLYALPDPRT